VLLGSPQPHKVRATAINAIQRVVLLFIGPPPGVLGNIDSVSH
jgi:hypothetical protein